MNAPTAPHTSLLPGGPLQKDTPLENQAMHATVTMPENEQSDPDAKTKHWDCFFGGLALCFIFDFLGFIPLCFMDNPRKKRFFLFGGLIGVALSIITIAVIIALVIAAEASGPKHYAG